MSDYLKVKLLNKVGRLIGMINEVKSKCILLKYTFRKSCNKSQLEASIKQMKVELAKYDDELNLIYYRLKNDISYLE